MLLTLLFLASAGFFAGLVDSIAGGGGLITLPALLSIGLPPHLALGTNKLQMTCGTSFAIINFHRKSKIIWKIAFVGIPFALVGSVIGAKLTFLIETSVLGKTLILILPPAALFMFISRSLLKEHAERNYSGINYWIITPLTCLIIGCYDGFFGPGTGTFMIVGLVLFSHLSLVTASATAKTFNLASNVGALFTFILAGHVDYLIGLVMAIANIAGNLIGSHYAMKHGNKFVQKILYVSFTLLFIYLVRKYY